MKKLITVLLTAIFLVTVSAHAQEIKDNEEYLLTQYSNLLHEKINANKFYPRIASMRGWEGSVQIQLLVDLDGNHINSRVYQSSGNYFLDDNALQLVRNNSPYPKPPQINGHKQINLFIPITYQKLSNIEDAVKK